MGGLLKSIIITRAIHELEESELNEVKTLLNSTNIIKICVNFVQYVGDIRVFHDHYYYPMYIKYPEKIIVTNKRVLNKYEIEEKDKDRVILYEKINLPFQREDGKLWFRSSSLTTAIDLSYSWLGVTECLLLATNEIDPNNKNFNKIPFEEQMQDNVSIFPNLYSYKEENNFKLQYKSLIDFINK